MVNVSTLLTAVNAPTGLWPNILNWIEASVVNYGWVIILFTLLVKVCLSPLDFLIKLTTKKTTLVQQKLAPQIARLNKKYANDRQSLQMQTNALYKKEGYNVFGSCIITLANLIVTMVVFFTLFAALRTMSAYKAINQYDQMQDAYTSTFETSIKTHVDNDLEANGYVLSEDVIKLLEGDSASDNIGEQSGYYLCYYYFQIINDFSETDNELLTAEQIQTKTFANSTKTTLQNTIVYQNEAGEDVTLYNVVTAAFLGAKTDAEQAANDTWVNVKDSWLWIGNIWVTDDYKSPLPSYENLVSMANSSKNAEYKNYVTQINPALYNNITKAVHSENARWNGYFILAILAAVTSFLSQWIVEKMGKSKSKAVNQLTASTTQAGGTMKLLKFLLPAIMVIFVMTSSSAFGLYIVSSSIIAIGISALTSVIVNAIYKKKEEEIMSSLEREAVKSVRRLNKNK